MALSNKWSASDLAYLFTADQLLRTVCLAHYHKQRHEKNIGELFSKSLRKTEDGDDHDNPVMLSYHTQKEIGVIEANIDIQIVDFMKRDEGHSMYRETKIVSIIDKSIDVVPPLIHYDPQDIKFYAGELSSIQLLQDLKKMYVPHVIAETI